MPITTKDIKDGRDPLLEALAKPNHTRGIYVRNTTLSLSDRMILEQAERRAEEKRQYDADVASGKIQLDLEGRQIIAPSGPKLTYINEGRDVLGDLMRNGR